MSKKCFVVQGFGEKTDFTNGRKLNLDASYRIIKRAVEGAGLECVRADEIVHSGQIDIPMYQWILDADLVIADLSTYNVNAAYELGVRYGVRPGATIIVAEDQLKYPFDVSHISILSYHHLGEDIGSLEAEKFAEKLTTKIRAIMEANKPDSPVYTLLSLDPPAPRREGVRAAAPERIAAPAEDGASAMELLEQARAAINESQFDLAKGLFKAVHKLRRHDEYVVQQLALATYKSKKPDPKSALLAAHELLLTLNPATTNNPETLGLWGAVHKRLWDLERDSAKLDASIEAYERGFYLKQDYYNGINLAYLYNVRAKEAFAGGKKADAVTDFMLARRVRGQVVPLCTATLAEMEVAPPKDPHQKYWVVATLWEAAFGMEDQAATQRWKDAATALGPADWMLDSTTTQIASLAALLRESPLAAAGLS